jgi:tRNA A37 threonylcarbamoyltransferase TsaD
MKALGVQEGIDVRFPSPALCTDNAVMVARAGLPSLEKGCFALDLQMNARSRWALSVYSM